MITYNIPVLLYHDVNNKSFENEFNIDDFEIQISYLKKNGYKSVHINEIDIKEKKQIVLTFDDGYKNLIHNVLPILKKYDFKACCFIVSNNIGKYNDWDTNKKNYQKKELMNKTDINEWLNNGMLIGSHSNTHKDLTDISNNELQKELYDSKENLENSFSQQIYDFCYPYGKINKEVYIEVKKIYKNAFTTNRSRYKYKKHNPILIPRVDMGKKISKFKIFLKLNTYYEDIKFVKNEF